MAEIPCHYELCIIGAGMFGSAAAKHASTKGWKMCIIGPEEPKERSVMLERDIFGAHYDEARITRCLDKDPVYAYFSQESIKRYRQLEQASGTTFYTEVGNLLAGNYDTDFIRQIKNNMETDNIVCEQMQKTRLKTEFPFIRLPDGDTVFYEKNNAGYINPRKMILAQLSVASKNGCDVIRDTVSRVTRSVTVTGETVMRITTDRGAEYTANKVLLATGAFTTLRNLLEPDMQPDISLVPVTVAKVEISADDAARIRTMPAIVYYGRGREEWWGNFPRDSNGRSAFYMLPAVKYPDGKHYLKLGHFHTGIDRQLETSDEIKLWFSTSGDASLVRDSARIIQDIVRVKGRSVHGDCCLVTSTRTDHPYIDMLHPQLGIVTGGNGYGAKSSDEVGRIAALMITEQKWDCPFSAENFKFRSKNRSQKHSTSKL